MVKGGTPPNLPASAASGSVKWEYKWVRKKGEKYLDSKGRESIWDGKDFRCPHYKARSLCKDCGGSQICEHGRQRALCKSCVGGSICEHGRQRPKCKDCGGSQICEHGRQKAECKACGGQQICEHNRQRANCKDCGGSQICEHGKVKSLCKECRAARTILGLSMGFTEQQAANAAPTRTNARSSSHKIAQNRTAATFAPTSSRRSSRKKSSILRNGDDVVLDMAHTSPADLSISAITGRQRRAPVYLSL
jgi:hypothetical protein